MSRRRLSDSRRRRKLQASWRSSTTPQRKHCCSRSRRPTRSGSASVQRTASLAQVAASRCAERAPAGSVRVITLCLCVQVTVRVGALPTDLGEKGDRFKVLLLPLPDDARQRPVGSERRDSQRASDLWAASDEAEAEVFKVRCAFATEPTLLGRISEEACGNSRSPPPVLEAADAAASAHPSQLPPTRGSVRTAGVPSTGLPIEQPRGLGLRQRRGYTLRD